LIITRAKAPVGTTADPRWSLQAGGWTMIGLHGFLTPDDPTAADLLTADPDARIAGRYPTPIEYMP
jgi:hypothetical protein